MITLNDKFLQYCIFLQPRKVFYFNEIAEFYAIYALIIFLFIFVYFISYLLPYVIVPIKFVFFVLHVCT